MQLSGYGDIFFAREYFFLNSLRYFELGNNTGPDAASCIKSDTSLNRIGSIRKVKILLQALQCKFYEKLHSATYKSVQWSAAIATIQSTEVFLIGPIQIR